MVHAFSLDLLRPRATAPSPLVMLVLDARSARRAAVCPVSSDPASNVQAGADPPLRDVHFAKTRDLGPHLLMTVRPEVILSPLVGDENDAVDIAVMLQDLGYDGRYRALAANLPDPAIVIAEVRAAAPALDFDLFLLTPESDAMAISPRPVPLRRRR